MAGLWQFASAALAASALMALTAQAAPVLPQAPANLFAGGRYHPCRHEIRIDFEIVQLVEIDVEELLRRVLQQ